MPIDSAVATALKASNASDNLLEFGELCRKNGLRVSTAEMLDTIRATELVGLDDPELLRGALEATLVKRRADSRHLRRAVRSLFFRGAAIFSRAPDERRRSSRRCAKRA